MASEFTYNFNLIFDLVMIIILPYVTYRKYERFRHIGKLKNVDFPFRSLYLGFFIYGCLIIFLMLDFVFKYILELDFPTYTEKLFPVFVLLIIIYLLSGRKPLIEENRFKLTMKYGRYSTGRFMGHDLLGCWIGSYDKGIIIYNYLIEKDTIEIIEKTPDKLVIVGKTRTKKYGNLDVTVTFNTRLSVDYITRYFKREKLFNLL